MRDGSDSVLETVAAGVGAGVATGATGAEVTGGVKLVLATLTGGSGCTG